MKVSKMWNPVIGNWRYTYFYLLKNAPPYDPEYTVKGILRQYNDTKKTEADAQFQLERSLHQSKEIPASVIQYVTALAKQDVTAFRKKIVVQTVEILCLCGEKKDKANLLKIFRAYTSNSRELKDLIADIKFDQRDFKSIMLAEGNSIGDKILTVDTKRENELWKIYKMYAKAAKDFGIDVRNENIVLRREPKKFYSIMKTALDILKKRRSQTLTKLLGHNDPDFFEIYQHPDVRQVVSGLKSLQSLTLSKNPL